VDKENRLVGIITVDDMVEIVEEEATEDFERMAGIAPSEDSYLRTGVFRHSRGRIGWLMVLMLAAVFTEMVIDSFEEALLLVPILAAFIPMLMDAGGNAGSQTSTLIIRSMVLGEIRFKDIFHVLWTEVKIALICGALLATASGIFIYYFVPDANIYVTLTVSFTLMAVALLANSLGCLIPMVGKKLRIDPAVFATPMLTTLKDAVSVLIYFYLARLIMGGL
jgi:magnesium transporter